MGVIEEREKNLKSICERISKIDYKTLISEFPQEYTEKIKSEIEYSGDLSIEDRLLKYKSDKTIDDSGKEIIGSIIKYLKNTSYTFKLKDVERLNYFTLKLDTLLKKTAASGRGMDGRVNLIKDGPSSLAKGHSLDIVQLFNDIKQYNNWNTFVDNTEIDRVFLEPGNITHFRYLYSSCKNCENKISYPLYYKQWQRLAHYFGGVEISDYDGFCNYYNSLQLIEQPKLLHFATYNFLLAIKLKKDAEYMKITSSENEKKQVENLIFVDKKEDNDDSEALNEDSILSDEFKFYQWIDANKDYAENSKTLCKSRIKNIAKLSISNELGNIFEWNFDEFKTKQNVLRGLPEFVKNSSTKGGDGWYSASLNKFQEYLYSKENNSLEIIEQDFKVWLTKKLPSSVSSYLGGKTYVNSISEKIGLGNFYLWTLNDFSKNKELLFNDSEFITKNTKGKAAYSNLINRFGDFLIEREGGAKESEPEDISIPHIKYDILKTTPREPEETIGYFWWWGSLKPNLTTNSLPVLVGVTEIIGRMPNKKVENNVFFKQELVTLEQNIGLEDLALSKAVGDPTKNIIASTNEYWITPGLMGRDKVLTKFGESVANGSINEDKFAFLTIQSLELPYTNIIKRYPPDVILEWERNNLQIKPLLLLINILIKMYGKNKNKDLNYFTTEELTDIILPIAADTPNNLDKYVNSILAYRSGILNISTWPKYTDVNRTPYHPRLIWEFAGALVNWGYLKREGTSNFKYFLTDKAISNFGSESNDLSEQPEDNSSNNDVCVSKTRDPENIIFYGAPGTGKSYMVSEILKERLPIKQCRDKFVFRVTFHPEYDHAAFLGGYKPYSQDGGNIEYKFVPQIFTNIFVKACNDPHNQYYLVIEEINRGNCAEIFGDLFQLLDRNEDYPINTSRELTEFLNGQDENNDKIIKNPTLFWDEKGKMLLPDNITLLATMNTSDQSLMPMDSAFKRRWDWEYVPIIYTEKDPETGNDNTSFKYQVQFGDPKETFSWIKFIETINNKISDIDSLGMDKCLGNYFVKVEKNAQNEYLISEETFINKVLFYLWNDVFKDENDEDGASIFKGMTFMSFFPKDDARKNIKKILKELDEVRFKLNKKDGKIMNGKIYEKNEPSESIKEKASQASDIESTETKTEE
jgi:hypothetical protein